MNKHKVTLIVTLDLAPQYSAETLAEHIKATQKYINRTILRPASDVTLPNMLRLLARASVHVEKAN